MQLGTQYIAFDGSQRVGSGSKARVAEAAKACVDAGMPGPLLAFNAVTSEPLDLDLRGTVDEVLARLPAEPSETPSPPAHDESAAELLPGSRSGPGRPRLGVVAREVTLLPRHWQWLSEQRGGASVTIRRLVDDARNTSAERDRRQRSQEYCYRFLSAMLGDAPGFEEATRALFAGDSVKFTECALSWPTDLRAHALHLAHDAFRT